MPVNSIAATIIMKMRQNNNFSNTEMRDMVLASSEIVFVFMSN